ncbi:MAG: hypothetical protein GYA23_01105 [Methanomicrobiales archaeon]|nr:hypothetical protein [Methanomicrobiales archaeon]
MYPDRATFQRMVEEEPNLSSAGRQTLLALFEGPLRLRQILDIVNAPGSGADEKNITESALRKRLEGLITRGILARAGSERTNPYYYIRRPWIFNQYILIRCRDKPGEGLLDLTILLHELSQTLAGGDASLPHPRYIAAVGERTERSHQIGNAYAAFQKLLGNKNAIGDYLEGIYEGIYEGRVPSSDIDALVARDFLRFVATAPDEEREVRLFLWYADFFHTLDRYQEAAEALRRGMALATEQKLDLAAILSDSRVSEGHILLHQNDLAGAKEAFIKESQLRGITPVAKARALFGAGEAELVLGDIALPYAPARFRQALELASAADKEGRDADIQELRADILRRTGSVHRILGRLEEANASYHEAQAIYQNGMPRGMVMLLPELAELARARAFAAATPAEAEKLLGDADRLYDEAKATAQRIRNINWFAGSLIGECEVARTAYEKYKKPLPKNLDTSFANAFEIYCQISSRRGIVQTFLAEALLYHSAPDQLRDKYAITADKLEQAERFSKELGLKPELELIKRLKSGKGAGPELNPLTFL